MRSRRGVDEGFGDDAETGEETGCIELEEAGEWQEGGATCGEK